MPGKPYLPLYTGDWLRDEKLSACEPATRGIFADWICHMHNGQVDRLTLTARQLGRLGRCDESEAVAAIQDLQKHNAATISERDGIWTVVSRRRKRELEISQKRKEVGSKGLANRYAKPLQNADNESEDKGTAESLEKVITYCREIGLPRTDAEWFWHKCEANGWVNGGKRILDWRKTLLSWKAAGYVPSIKNPRKGVTPPAEPKQSKPQPNGWDQWRKERYPDAKETDFWRVPDDVKREFNGRQSAA